MRNIFFIALVALCFAFPGKAEANTTSSSFQTVFMDQGEMDPALVEAILRAVQVEYGYDYACLCEQYQNGELTIEKNGEGYLVSLVDGSLTVSIILDGQL